MKASILNVFQDKSHGKNTFGEDQLVLNMGKIIASNFKASGCVSPEIKSKKAPSWDDWP